LGALWSYLYHTLGCRSYCVEMDTYSKGNTNMSQIVKSFISVGIDVAADFSEMAIALPTLQFLDKRSFRIYHYKPESLSAALKKIKKAEDEYSMKVRIFMESTGIYHYPLFCFFRDAGFQVDVINPLITNSTRNSNIRKVKNDNFDAQRIAKTGFDPNLKLSNMPQELVMNFRNLTREYYSLVDFKSSYVLKLGSQIRMAFPQFKGIFSDLTGKTSMMILKKYTSPDEVLTADPNTLAEEIAISSRRRSSAGTKRDQLIQAANDAKTFGCGVQSNFHLIKRFIQIIEFYEEQINDILQQMKSLVNEHQDELFIQQVDLLQSIKGIGFLSALTLMCEIGDYAAFTKPKQLFAYFGLDPSVNQSGKFNGNRMTMSKRGSRIARRVLHMVAVQSVGVTSKGEPKNSVLREFYLKKCDEGKAKMVALGAVSHKICNIIFAVLRDHKPYVIKTPQQHCLEYVDLQASCITSTLVS
jgi:transposase